MDEGYEIRLWWSDEDRCYVAKVAELEGCMSHGDTPENALSAIQEAKALWLDMSRRHGDPIPEPSHRRRATAGA